jgi:hypothetical protein
MSGSEKLLLGVAGTLMLVSAFMMWSGMRMPEGRAKQRVVVGAFGLACLGVGMLVTLSALDILD